MTRMETGPLRRTGCAGLSVRPAWPAAAALLAALLGGGRCAAQEMVVAGDVEVIAIPAEIGEPVDDQALAEPIAAEEIVQRQIEQQAVQYEQLMRVQLNAELELIRSLAEDLTPDQRARIVAAGEEAARAAARRISETLHTPQVAIPVAPLVGAINGLVESVNKALGVDAPAAAGTDDVWDPGRDLSRSLAGALEAEVGAERAHRYAAELVDRERRRREATVRRVVSVLDEDLVLTARQREAITADLLEHWQESMAMVLTIRPVINGRRTYPGIPSERLLVHLTDLQRKEVGLNGESRQIPDLRRQWMQGNLFRRINTQASGERDPWWFP